MSRRSLTILVTAWALILAPALCTAGMLAHGCLCEDEVACEHEADCVTDPCSDVALRQQDETRDHDDTAAVAWMPVPGDPSAPAAVAPPVRVSPPEAPGEGRPYPPSDLPLRI